MPMSLAPTEAVELMTVEEFLALPGDSDSRELIRGRLRKRIMTVHRSHARLAATLTRLLTAWLAEQPEPRGRVLGTEPRLGLRGTTDSLIAVDVAYTPAAFSPQSPNDATILDGAPVLAVEIISPTATQGEIVERVRLLNEAGVVVWLVSYAFQIVDVHRPDRVPESFNCTQVLVTEPELPGFRVAVSRIFDV